MAVDQFLGDRISDVFKASNVDFYTKKMFGGLCFMVDDKMCCGIYKGGIMARIEPGEVEQLIQRPGAEQMIHGGRKMTGYLMLNGEAYDMDEDLEFWIKKCLEFNPKAKSSKKKK